MVMFDLTLFPLAFVMLPEVSLDLCMSPFHFNFHLVFTWNFTWSLHVKMGFAIRLELYFLFRLIFLHSMIIFFTFTWNFKMALDPPQFIIGFVLSLGIHLKFHLFSPDPCSWPCDSLVIFTWYFMCPVVFEKPRIPGCPRCWRNAIGLLHFFIPAKHERKRGHKPSEAYGDPCSDLCSCILFIVVSSGLLWTAFRHDDFFPLASLFHMHAVTRPICIFICWIGTCGLGDAFDILSTFTSRMFSWLQPFTCSPTCFRWHDPTEESFEEENSQEYDHWTTKPWPE